jgi:hypothetical protein
MKRRTFLQMVGASALGLPFMYSQLGSASGKAGPGAALSHTRLPWRLHFSSDEAALFSLLQSQSEGVYLVGGGVLGKTSGHDLPYLNLLVDSRNFGAIKQDLFRFGVVPVSTPELPSYFIRFVHEGRAYSALNMELAPFLAQNVLGPKLRLLPLAHNFLVFSTDESWVIDPHGALAGPAEGTVLGRIKLLREPESAVVGLEICLAVAFDTALLGLKPPARHASFEQAVLGCTATQEGDALLVFHQVVSYLPDLMEVRGLDFTRKYLVSPLCVSAAAAGPGINLRNVDASLQALHRRGQEVASAHLFAAINKEFGPRGQVTGTGLPDFLAAKQMPVRRKDLLARLLGEKDLLAEV